MDDFCDTRGALDVGVGERLHDWRIYSCPSGYRNHCGLDQSNFRTQTFITIGINEGRTDTEEVSIYLV